MKSKYFKIVFFLIFLCVLSSCEYIARSIFAPDHCQVCEVRVGVNKWANEPVWKEDGCGGKLSHLADSCKVQAERHGGECICIFYTR